MGPQRREVGPQICGYYLEERLRLAQAAQPMRAQAPEAYAGRPGPAHGIPGRGREQDLPAVSSRADPGDRVHGHTDVACIGQRGTPAMEAGSEPDLDTIGPGPFLHGPFDGKGGLERRRSAIEDCENFIPASIDLAARSASLRPAIGSLM